MIVPFLFIRSEKKTNASTTDPEVRQGSGRAKYLDVFVTEDYQANDGEEKTAYTRDGAAFPHKKGCGFNIELTEGISVSGQLVALPPRPREEKQTS